MILHKAFTMIELIFVIVVMGIIGQFGAEFLAQSYNSFIFSKINNTLQSNSATAVEFIASRLQHRNKDSVIVRTGETTVFTALKNASGQAFTVLEWISIDEDNFRGTTTPNWSGIIDLNQGVASGDLFSPGTNTNTIDNVISSLSYTKSGIDDAALFFIGANTDINGYGWDGNGIGDQTSVMHPINDVSSDTTRFTPAVGNFTGVDIFEYYKLAWTANAIVMKNYDTGKYTGKSMGDLVFYYNYQPWDSDGEKFYDTDENIQHFTIMENVSTFQAMSIGSVIKIQVCTKSDIVEEYSLCKEKTIF
ncbi:MAG: protein containing prepilin-type N- cleavage/methylation domain protein [Epsilonproteobacteria bacterium]|nr:MAG: protein containing prepilin-type N- cleavage/methylation domain protein [Campylobacterota bacterium]